MEYPSGVIIPVQKYMWNRIPPLIKCKLIIIHNKNPQYGLLSAIQIQEKYSLNYSCKKVEESKNVNKFTKRISKKNLGQKFWVNFSDHQKRSFFWMHLLNPEVNLIDKIFLNPASQEIYENIKLMFNKLNEEPKHNPMSEIKESSFIIPNRSETPEIIVIPDESIISRNMKLLPHLFNKKLLKDFEVEKSEVEKIEPEKSEAIEVKVIRKETFTTMDIFANTISHKDREIDKLKEKIALLEAENEKFKNIPRLEAKSILLLKELKFESELITQKKFLGELLNMVYKSQIDEVNELRIYPGIKPKLIMSSSFYNNMVNEILESRRNNVTELRVIF